MKSSASEPGLTHFFGLLIFERMSAEGGILLHLITSFIVWFISHYSSLPASVVPWLLITFLLYLGSANLASSNPICKCRNVDADIPSKKVDKLSC